MIQKNRIVFKIAFLLITKDFEVIFYLKNIMRCTKSIKIHLYNVYLNKYTIIIIVKIFLRLHKNAGYKRNLHTNNYNLHNTTDC